MYVSSRSAPIIDPDVNYGNIELIHKVNCDGSGHIYASSGDQLEKSTERKAIDVDDIIFCTGYRYSMPFLRGMQDVVSITDGE